MIGKTRRRLILLASTTAIVLVCAAVFVVAAASHKKKLPVKPIDLNTATVGQLEQLPGIGPTTAQAIIRFREKSGPFQRVEDLIAIPRLSKARLEKLRPYVTVGQPAKKRKR